MKKILAAVFALAIIFPAMTAQAAYVTIPSFSDIALNSSFQKSIEFLGYERLEYEGVKFSRWKYRIVNGRTNEYVSRYIKKINHQVHFQLIAQEGENWYFLYTGNQAKNLKLIAEAFHIHVGVSGDYVIIDLVSGMYLK